MRILLSIILFTILSACSTTGFSKQSSIVGPFKVVGRGHSEESAKNDVFKKAIEYSRGVAIQSERIIQNDNVSRNYILTHSSGYVDSYKVTNTNQLNDYVELHMEVYVKPTYIDDYVIKSSDKNFRVEGDALKESLNTFHLEKTKGDELLMSVLKDYPEKSYDFKVEPVTFKVDGDRVLFAEVTYKLKWSDSYLRSLAQTLKMVSDSDCQMLCNNLPFYKLSYKKNDGDWINTNDHIYFKDATRPQLVHKYLRGMYFPSVYSKSQQKHANVRYVIRVDFMDAARNILNTSCHYSPHANKQDFYGGEQFFINNQPLVEETFKIIIKRNKWQSDHYKNIGKYDNINVSITRPDRCQDL
jgi:hypothetical protein